jgi:asparagine synthase (glutamine-hydrolysing)
VDCYWDWTFPDRGTPDARSLPEAVEGLRERLSQAVRLQVRADVPVGAYASGGLDSSVIIALVKRLTEAPLHTFSLRFDDAEFDEGSFQRALVERYGTVHSELRVSRADIGNAFAKAIWHIESPILRTAPIPMMLLSRLVRKSGYKVVLTGEGADEVLAGYDLFRESKIRRFWAKNPQSQMRPALLRRLYPYLTHSPAALSAYSARFFGEGIEHHQKPYFSHVPRWRTTQRTWRFFSTDLRQRLAGLDTLARMERYLPKRMQGWRPLDRDQYIEAHTLLSGYILSAQGDRVAMANSVEGRVPFLDHHVIDYCNHLPTRYKIMGLNEKFVLKEAARGLVPDVILERKKQPYRAPDSASFFACAESKALTDELLSPGRLRDAGYFDVDATQKLLAKCRDGRAIGFADNMAFVGIMSTMMLDDLFMRGHGLSSPPDNDRARSTEPIEVL